MPKDSEVDGDGWAIAGGGERPRVNARPLQGLVSSAIRAAAPAAPAATRVWLREAKASGAAAWPTLPSHPTATRTGLEGSSGGGAAAAPAFSLASAVKAKPANAGAGTGTGSGSSVAEEVDVLGLTEEDFVSARANFDEKTAALISLVIAALDSEPDVTMAASFLAELIKLEHYAVINKFSGASASVMSAAVVAQLILKLVPSYFSLAERIFLLVDERKPEFLDLNFYNAFISEAAKVEKYSEAKVILTKAKLGYGVADKNKYYHLIVAAGRDANFPEAELAFNEAKKIAPLDASLYAAFIKAAARAGEFRAAEAAYVEIRKIKGLVNTDVYNSGLYALREEEQFDDAEELFGSLRASRTMSINAESINQVLHLFLDQIKVIGEDRVLERVEKIAQKKVLFEDAKIAFNLAKASGWVNKKMFKNIIYIANEAEAFDEAEEFFAEAEARNLVDAKAYQHVVYAMLKRQKYLKVEVGFVKGRDYFKKAVSRGLANPMIFADFIELACKYEQYAEAYKLFKQVLSQGLASGKAYRSIAEVPLKRAGDSSLNRVKLFAEIKLQLEEAEKCGLADEAVYRDFISAALKLKYYDEAKTIFETKIKTITSFTNEFSHALIYKTFIKNTNDFAAARSAYLHALTLGFESKSEQNIYDAYIPAAIKHNQSVEADRARAEAERKGLFNREIVVNCIRAAAESGQFELADRYFKELKDAAALDPFAYRNIIMANVLGGQYGAAKALLIEGGLVSKLKINSQRSKKANAGYRWASLHEDFDFTSAYIACIYLFEQGLRWTLVVGKATHSFWGSSIREAVQLFCQMQGVSLREDSSNAGQFHCEGFPETHKFNPELIKLDDPRALYPVLKDMDESAAMKAGAGYSFAGSPSGGFQNKKVGTTYAYKADLCRFFATRRGCEKGAACSYAHGEAELRNSGRSY